MASYDMKLELLFNAFCTPYNFYLLGAGASAGIIPRTQEVRNIIIPRYDEFGSYPVEPSSPDAVKDRIIGDSKNYADPLKAAKLRVLPSSAVHAMTTQVLALPELDISPPQYSVFSLAYRPSTICSMNVDGLAKRYCPSHIVLEPHGQVPSEIVQSPFWDQLIDDLLEFGFPTPKIPDLLLPQPEPKDITNRPDYNAAIKLFPKARCLTVIGYTFGQFRSSIDDFETFEFFMELLRRYPKSVLVIDPHPGPVVAVIQNAVRQRTVYSIPVYWDHLSLAIVKVASNHQCWDPLRLTSLKSEILYRYKLLNDLPHAKKKILNFPHR